MGTAWYEKLKQKHICVTCGYRRAQKKRYAGTKNWRWLARCEYCSDLHRKQAARRYARLKEARE